MKIKLPPQWRAGLTWLAVLGPLFFLSYGFANHRAAAMPTVPSIVFDWERHIPLLPWTILPYWSIDLFYGLSLLICRSRKELMRHALRLLTAQIICISAFVLFPLQFSTPRPEVTGWAGELFSALADFDLPYNQAPSLHIVLLLILWDFYRRRLHGAAKGALHVWSTLIALSVLTTFQHHAIDIPAGLLAGALCLWLWPLQGPLLRWRWTPSPMRRRLALFYGSGALTLVLAAILGGTLQRAAWLLYWPALSLALVALCYAGLGPAGFQKRGDGRHSLAVRLLLWPYRGAAWFNARCWTRRLPASVPLSLDDKNSLWMGRMPLPWEADHQRFPRLVDVAAELAAGHRGTQSVGWLDLVEPSSAQLLAAAHAVQRVIAHGPVLVCCALGFSRSAAVVATWACVHGGCRGVEEAVARIRAARPEIVLAPALLRVIEQAVARGGRA